MRATSLRLVFLLAALPTVPLRAQAPVPLAPPGVHCSLEDVRAAAITDSMAGPDAEAPERTKAPPMPSTRGLPDGEQLTVLEFVVDTTGRLDPCSIEVASETSREWTTRIMERVLQLRFRPARYEGRPLRTRIQQAFRAR